MTDRRPTAVSPPIEIEGELSDEGVSAIAELLLAAARRQLIDREGEPPDRQDGAGRSNTDTSGADK